VRVVPVLTSHALVETNKLRARSSIFALSLDCNILGGYAWALVMMAACIGGAALSRSLETGAGDAAVAAVVVDE
jgi:hypothetical protein